MAVTPQKQWRMSSLDAPKPGLSGGVHLNIRSIWSNIDDFKLWLMQVLQELRKDGHEEILEQIIYLLHRLWENGNTILHQGKFLSPEAESANIHNGHYLHSVLSSTCNRKEPQIISIHDLLPSSSSLSSSDWLILLVKH